jgi:SAM-dependent methyltransferase
MPTSDEPLHPSDARYWERAYREGRTGWELGEAAPPLVRALRALPVRHDAVVLGCGRGHEVRMLAALGWPRVVGVDFAASALAEARAHGERVAPAGAAQAAHVIEWLHDDVLALGSDRPNAFDLVVEHTCYCAIDPVTRDSWAGSVSATLRPAGVLVALFYTHARPGGPPFGATAVEVVAGLEAHGLVVEHQEQPADSAPKRAGDETLVIARRR